MVLKFFKILLKAVALYNMFRLGMFAIWLFGNLGFLAALVAAICVFGLMYEFIVKDRSVWGIILWAFGTFAAWWILYGFFGLGYSISQALV